MKRPTTVVAFDCFEATSHGDTLLPTSSCLLTPGGRKNDNNPGRRRTKNVKFQQVHLYQIGRIAVKDKIPI